MVRGQATVHNAAGIHVRPAGVIYRAARAYDGSIRIRRDEDEYVDLKSVMGLIALGLIKGDTVSIEVYGPEEKRLLSEITELIERNHDYPPR